MAENQRRRPPALLFKLMNPVMAFMVRHNIGSLSSELMIITHTGRKSGRQYSTPIGYTYDGDTLLGFTISGRSQWYLNVQQNPQVVLTIKGQPVKARTELVNDLDEVAKLLDIYKHVQSKRYEQFFGVPFEMPAEVAARSPNLRAKYVRFHPAPNA